MLRVENLVKTYPQGDSRRSVLSGVQFELTPATATALIGRSGSGKSTLLNLIAGLDIPDQGQVWIDGQDVTKLDDQARSVLRRQKLGFVFQQFHLLPSLTVAENVSVSLELLGQHDPTRVAEVLNLVGLSEYLQTFPDRLSGGEQQRVAIARALVHRPPLLLADEPTGNLDEENAERVLEMLLQLTQQQGTTCLIVTHSAEVASRCQSRLLLHKQIIETQP